MVSSFSMADSFSVDSRMETIFHNTPWTDQSSTVRMSSMIKQNTFTHSDSFVLKSDLDIKSPISRIIVLTESVSDSGDAFLSRWDEAALAGCRIDGSALSTGFMICTVKDASLDVR